MPQVHASPLLSLLAEVFSWLPVGTVIDNRVLVVHGGVTSQLDIDWLQSIDRHQVGEAGLAAPMPGGGLAVICHRAARGVKRARVTSHPTSDNRHSATRRRASHQLPDTHSHQAARHTVPVSSHQPPATISHSATAPPNHPTHTTSHQPPDSQSPSYPPPTHHHREAITVVKLSPALLQFCGCRLFLMQLVRTVPA